MLLIPPGSGRVAGTTGAVCRLPFNPGASGLGRQLAVAALEPPLLPLLPAALMCQGMTEATLYFTSIDLETCQVTLMEHCVKKGLKDFDWFLFVFTCKVKVQLLLSGLCYPLPVL